MESIPMDTRYRLQITWVQLLEQVALFCIMIAIPMFMMMAMGKSALEAFFGLKYLIPHLLILYGGFLLNYFWLIPRYLLPKQYRKYTVLIILSYLLLTLASNQLSRYIYADFVVYPKNIPSEFFWAMFLIEVLLNMLVFFVAISQRSRQLNHVLEVETEIQQKERYEEELERLKGQLNPHFLFNTLNNISSLAAFDPDATQTAIAHLSDMLRYVLYETSASTVPLEKDVTFLQNYIDLMHIRYEDTLHLDIRLNTQHPECQIPPMLFISLLENAFKYGATSLHDCSIEVRLADREDGLVFTVRNTLLTPEEMQSKKKGGVGIQNLKKRLELLFPKRHLLTCGMVDDSHYEAKLELTI